MLSCRSLFSALAIALIAWLVLVNMQKNRNRDLDRLRDKLEDFSLKCKRQFGPDGRMKVQGRKAYSPRHIRKSYRSPLNLCDYSERAIAHFMALPHNCSRQANRVWLQGEWMDANKMEAALAAPAAEGDDPIKCAVFCAEFAGPCPHGKCLLPLYMRRNTTDAKAAAQILENGDFDVVKPQMDLSRVLDGGAGIGVSSILFATMFPEADILSVEASAEKYEMLLLNARSFPNIIPVQAGLWPRVVRLQAARAQGDTAGPLEEAGPNKGSEASSKSIHGLSLEFLMNFFKLGSFDLVKLDIAGNEREFLSTASSNPMKWLDESKMAMVSIHENLKGGAKDAVTKTFAERPQWRYLGWWKKYRVYKAKGFDES